MKTSKKKIQADSRNPSDSAESETKPLLPGEIVTSK